MIAAITATGDTVQSPVDERFGRAAFFVLVDTASGERLRAIDNSSGVAAQSGAGTNAAQTLSQAGVSVVLTGSIGPKAYDALSAAGVKIYTGASGTVAQTLEAFRVGKLQATTGGGPANWRAGRGQGRGMSRGRGGGRGSGGGGGGGGGRGRR